MTSGAEEPVERFSLVAGGPFHGALRRMGPLGEDRLPTMKAAFGLALVAWLLPGLTAATQSLVDASYTGWDYFSDLTVYARFLIAIGLMIATERHADGRLELLARQFERAKIIGDDALPALRSELARADRLSASTLVEGVLATVALVWSGLTTRLAVEIAKNSWEGKVDSGGAEMSWAGEELLGHPDASSLADLNASLEAIEEMHLVPVDREAVLGVLVAAGLPMLAFAGTQIPFTELLKWIAGAIF
jgi:hypothetical protein